MADLNILNDVLQRNETTIVQRWIDSQLAGAGYRADRISRAEIAEGTTFRPGDERSFLILEADTMSTADPISLAQTKRLAANADTVLLRATRAADLETRSVPSCASTTAARRICSNRWRAASASGATRSSASVPAGCSRSATARPGSRPAP